MSAQFSKEELLYLARIAEQGERYEEMIQFVKDLLKDQHEINHQERNLLSMCFKNAVSKRRSSLQIVDHYEIKEEQRNVLSKRKVLENYRMQIGNELKKLCSDAIDTSASLLERIEDTETKVFLYKMQADFYRYMCEYEKGEARLDAINRAEETYKLAEEISEDLSAANAVRLGLLLNFSVFYYEIKNEKEEACAMARRATDQGIVDLENAGANSKEATMILQLFSDNLSIWA